MKNKEMNNMLKMVNEEIRNCQVQIYNIQKFAHDHNSPEDSSLINYWSIRKEAFYDVLEKLKDEIYGD